MIRIAGLVMAIGCASVQAIDLKGFFGGMARLTLNVMNVVHDGYENFKVQSRYQPSVYQLPVFVSTKNNVLPEKENVTLSYDPFISLRSQYSGLAELSVKLSFLEDYCKKNPAADFLRREVSLDAIQKNKKLEDWIKRTNEKCELLQERMNICEKNRIQAKVQKEFEQSVQEALNREQQAKKTYEDALLASKNSLTSSTITLTPGESLASSMTIMPSGENSLNASFVFGDSDNNESIVCASPLSLSSFETCSSSSDSGNYFTPEKQSPRAQSPSVEILTPVTPKKEKKFSYNNIFYSGTSQGLCRYKERRKKEALEKIGKKCRLDLLQESVRSNIKNGRETLQEVNKNK